MLKVTAVDLKAGRPAVRRSLLETFTGHKFEKLKRASGKGRLVKLPQRAVEAL